jgi:hypothetical protein
LKVPVIRIAWQWGLAAALAVGPLHVCAQSLTVRHDSGRIRVSSPKALFLEGRSLEKLHSGASVVFAIQISMHTGAANTVLRRQAGRFAISFDLWEERFAVALLGSPRKSASHMSAAEAETWCLDNLPLSSAGLSPDSAFSVTLDVRAEEPDDGPPLGEDLGVTVARIVELFSRPQRSGDTRKQVKAGPFHLKDLR